MIRRRPFLTLVVAAVFFAAMATCARVERNLGAASLVFVRMSMGALACGALFASGRARWRTRRPSLLLLRGLFGSCAILLYFFALTRMPVGEATLLNYTSPLFTAIFAMIFLAERPGARPLVGLGVTLAGLALTVQAGGPVDPLGLAAGAGSAMMSGAAVATVRSARQSEETTMIFFVFCLVALVLCGPFAMGGWRTPTGHDLLLLAGVGAFSTIAQLLFTAAMGYLPAVAAALAFPLTPVTAYLFGALLLGEPLTPRIGLGILVALAGVGLGSLQPGENAASPDPSATLG